MTYLQQLIAEKEAREHYERDARKLKELILKINDMHAVYDGEFLSELDKFVTKFKPTRKKKR